MAYPTSPAPASAAEEVVRGLTEAQRRMMLRADCGLRVTTVDMRVLPALHRLGLISRSADGRMAVSEGGKVHLSHLGLEVRAFLKDQEQ